jgi:osmotically-inducible protein OsmY
VILSDKDIKRAVENAILWDSRIESPEISADVENGGVTLSGTVPDLASRKYAEDNAYLVPGVLLVTNNIHIRLSHKTPPDDLVQSNIRNVLFYNPSIDAARIDVIVSKGLVTLKGTVNAFWKKQKAEEIVSNIRGVQKIINELGVVTTLQHADEDIANHIIESFTQDMYIISSNITVQVNNGTVTLTGTASSWIAKRKAEEIANNTSGVSNVDNRITVQLPKEE